MQRFLFLLISFIVALTAPLLHAAEAEAHSDHGSTLQEILVLNSYHPGYAWSDVVFDFENNPIERGEIRP